MRVSGIGSGRIGGLWSTALVAAICAGAACASSDEVAEARLAEERWERAPAAAPGAEAAAVTAVEELRFDPGTAALTASARASLARLAARLQAAEAGCQVDLQPAPDAANDPDLTRKRVAAVRRFLSRQQGIAKDRILEQGISEHGVSEQGVAAASGRTPRCVVVANLD